MTRRAFGMLLVGVLLWFIARSTGVPAYYVMSYAVFFAWVASLFSALCALLTARVWLFLSNQLVSRGHSVTLYMHVMHVCPLPIASLTVTLETPQERLDATRMSAGPWPFIVKKQKRRLNCPHRGVYDLAITRIESRDALNLFCFTRVPKRSAVTLTVQPHVRTLSPLTLSTGDGGSRIYRRASDDMSYPSDVRTYKDGDALKRVHWKLSLRKREIMVRTFEAAARPDTLILLDTTPESDLDVTDALCEVAASIANAQITAGYPVYMPLYAGNMREIDGNSGAAMPIIIDALTHLTFNGAYEMPRILAQEITRARVTGGIVLITHRLSGTLADEAVRISGSGVKVRVYFVAYLGTSDADSRVALLLDQGVDALIVDPSENAIDPQGVDLS